MPAENRIELTLPKIDSSVPAAAKEAPGGRRKKLTMASLDSAELSLYRQRGRLAALPGTTRSKECDELGRSAKHRQLSVEGCDKKEPVHEYIQNTRGILMAKLMMEDKKKEAEKMTEYIQRKEDILKLNREIYEQDKKMVNDYVEYMKDQADQQKQKTDSVIKVRQNKEAELEELRRRRTEMKKRISEDREECRTLMDYKKFIFELNPAVRDEIEKRKGKRRAAATFMTQQQQQEERKDQPEFSRRIAEQLRELKDELDLSENDSDTEIPTGFTNVDDMLSVLQQKETKNLALIMQTRKTQDELEQARKEYSRVVDERREALEHIRRVIGDLTDEEKKKQSRLRELMEREQARMADGTRTPRTAAKIAERVKEMKKELAALVREIRKVCFPNNKFQKEGGAEEPYTLQKMLGDLKQITEYMVTLKQTREWKILDAAQTQKNGAADIIKMEDTEARKWRETLADESRRQAEVEDARKKAEAQARRNIPRVQKLPKELIQKRLLQTKVEKKDNDKDKNRGNEFDDRYFVD